MFLKQKKFLHKSLMFIDQEIYIIKIIIKQQNIKPKQP